MTKLLMPKIKRQVFCFSVATFSTALCCASEQTNIPLQQPNQILLPIKASVKEFDSTLLLQKYFEQQNYTWPIANLKQIPNILIKALPKDLKKVPSVKTKKTLFIRILLPIILAEQHQIMIKRKRVAKLIERGGDGLTTENNVWFANLIKEYRINKLLSSRTQKQQLLIRVDFLPSELVLAQAAIESGWGTSRFALEGNSLFGEWTFGEQAGLVPNNRHSGKTHQVKKFESLRHSVRSYIKNINRNSAYKELRVARYEMRKSSNQFDALELARYLHRYSQKGDDYVKILHQILTSAEFVQIAKFNLRADFAAPSI